MFIVPQLQLYLDVRLKVYNQRIFCFRYILLAVVHRKLLVHALVWQGFSECMILYELLTLTSSSLLLLFFKSGQFVLCYLGLFLLLNGYDFHAISVVVAYYRSPEALTLTTI